MSDENYKFPLSPRRHGATKTNNRIMRGIFGVIMIIVYVGMGVLLLINSASTGTATGRNRLRCGRSAL